MLARLRKSLADKEQGFTLIELLVVMVIIGILAAIAIPVFLSQREKAQDSAARADVATLGKEISTWYVDNSAIPAVATSSARYTVGGNDAGKVSANNTLVSNFGAAALATATTATTTGWTATAWCVAVYNSSSQNYFKYSAQNGLESGNCTSATAP